MTEQNYMYLCIVYVYCVGMNNVTLIYLGYSLLCNYDNKHHTNKEKNNNNKAMRWFYKIN